MANQPAQQMPTRFRKGQILTAADMNKILDMLIKRIEGGRGIKVRAFGGRIVIETKNG